MESSDLRHRLLAVMAADAVGYSRLMSNDDRGTVHSLEVARGVFREQTSANGGRVIDTAGDSVLAVFDSASGAVSAAIAVQQRLSVSAADLSEDRRMYFRVGVHLGDVIEKADGTVYGDGVNIAARLQGLAEPGGITVSESIRSAVKGKVMAIFEDQGEQVVKNIADSVRAWRARSADDVGLAAGAMTPQWQRATGIDLSAPVAGFGGRPAIAVLPFTNMSRDPEQEYLADGIAEDVLTRLAMWRWLPVIARNSTFIYKGRAVDIKEVGRAVGARYVLEGSVRRFGDRVRVTAQLIDASTGHHVWAERYDRVVEDLFRLQDELTDGIVASLEDRVGRAELERARVKPPVSLDAWEAMQRAIWHSYRYTRDDCAQAEVLCVKALDLNPEMSQALSVLANLRRTAGLLRWQDPATAMVEAVTYARRAVSSDGNDPWACATLGLVLATVGQLDEGLASATRSVELNPSGTLGYNAVGLACIFLGEWQRGIQAMETAIRINPADQMMSASLLALSMNLNMNGDFQRAAEVGRLSVQRPPVFPVAWRGLASALGHLGCIDEAAEALRRAVGLMPEYPSEDLFRTTMPFRQESMLQHYLDGLRKAGWAG